MKYKCLVLDHDDTAVQSSPEIHYPSFQKILAELRPEVSMSYDEFMKYCFDPGFSSLCYDILHFTDDEMVREAEIWRSYTSRITPHFYDGFIDMVRRFRNGGGCVCVVSHSDASEISRHYAEFGITPDLIFGWEYPEHQRKPHPYPLEQIMSRLRLKNTDLIVLDDLRLGYDMAKACDVFFAAAGWSHTVPEIADFMKKNSDIYFKSVSEFENFIFG